MSWQVSSFIFFLLASSLYFSIMLENRSCFALLFKLESFNASRISFLELLTPSISLLYWISWIMYV